MIEICCETKLYSLIGLIIRNDSKGCIKLLEEWIEHFKRMEK